MHIFVAALHIALCIFLILTVLLQTGRGANMGSVFGSGSSQTIFGSSGPGTFLGKATTVIAMFFMLTSFYLTYSTAHKSSLMEKSFNKPATEQTVPVDQDGKGAVPKGITIP